MWDDEAPFALEGCIPTPEDFRVVDLSGASFLAGPTGAFLVVTGDDPEVLDLLALRTDQVRMILGRHLQWVPFLHPVVVSETPQLVPRAVPLTPEALARRLPEGRRALEPETLSKIDEIVARRL